MRIVNVREMEGRACGSVLARMCNVVEGGYTTAARAFTQAQARCFPDYLFGGFSIDPGEGTRDYAGEIFGDAGV